MQVEFVWPVLKMGQIWIRLQTANTPSQPNTICLPPISQSITAGLCKFIVKVEFFIIETLGTFLGAKKCPSKCEFVPAPNLIGETEWVRFFRSVFRSIQGLCCASGLASWQGFLKMNSASCLRCSWHLGLTIWGTFEICTPEKACASVTLHSGHALLIHLVLRKKQKK